MIKIRDRFKGPPKVDSSSSTVTPQPIQPGKGGDGGPIQSAGFVIGGIGDSDALRELQRKVSGQQVRTDTLVKIAAKDPRFSQAMKQIADDLEGREGATEREQALGKLIRTYLS